MTSIQMIFISTNNQLFDANDCRAFEESRESNINCVLASKFVASDDIYFYVIN